MSHKVYSSVAEKQRAYRQRLAAKRACDITVAAPAPKSTFVPFTPPGTFTIIELTSQEIAWLRRNMKFGKYENGEAQVTSRGIVIYTKNLMNSRLVHHVPNALTSELTVRNASIVQPIIDKIQAATGEPEIYKVVDREVARATVMHETTTQWETLCGLSTIGVSVGGTVTCKRCIRIKEAAEAKAARRAKRDAFLSKRLVVPVESEVQTLVRLCGDYPIEDWIDFIARINDWFAKRLDSSPGEFTLGCTVPDNWPIAKLWDAMRADDFSYCFKRLDEKNLERAWQEQRTELGRNPTEAEYIDRWIADEIVQEEKVS